MRARRSVQRLMLVRPTPLFSKRVLCLPDVCTMRARSCVGWRSSDARAALVRRSCDACSTLVRRLCDERATFVRRSVRCSFRRSSRRSYQRWFNARSTSARRSTLVRRSPDARQTLVGRWIRAGFHILTKLDPLCCGIAHGHIVVVGAS